MLTANDRRDTHSTEYLQSELRAARRAGCLFCILSAVIVIVLAVMWSVL